MYTQGGNQITLGQDELNQGHAVDVDSRGLSTYPPPLTIEIIGL